jgi:hypothetical protein
MSKILDFRRRTRPGWIRPNGSEMPTKRLKGLEEFVKPEFVGRMNRIRRQRRLTFIAMLISAVLTGAAIGWNLI